jgi:hypothetical protein
MQTLRRKNFGAHACPGVDMHSVVVRTLRDRARSSVRRGAYVIATSAVLTCALTYGCSGSSDSGCGSFDVGTDWDAAKRSPVADGVSCLRRAMESGDLVDLRFEYDARPYHYDLDFQVTGKGVVEVVTRRTRLSSGQVQVTTQECRNLGVDDGGAPFVTRCRTKR